jgi:hypothetical protein
LRDAQRLLTFGIVKCSPALLSLGLDLCVPPLALLLLLVAALWLSSALLFLVAGAAGPVVLSSAAAVLLTVSVLLSWSRYARGVISLGELLWAGAYAIRKVPLYLRFLLAKQSDWVRSKRD